MNRYGLNGCQASVIYNGVDSSFFSPTRLAETREQLRERLELPVDSPVLISVGQLRPEKGHLMLLSAFADLLHRERHVPYLLLVGEGVQREVIEAKIAELEIGHNVRLIGAVDDVRPYLKAADLFVLASIAVETFSNAALEAAAMELPIVMSDVGGAPEMFPHEQDCIIYSRNDKTALFEALSHSLERLESGESDGSALRDQVLNRYTTQAMDEEWRKVVWDGPAANAVASRKHAG